MAGKTSVPGSDWAQDGLTSLVRSGEDGIKTRLLTDTAKLQLCLHSFLAETAPGGRVSREGGAQGQHRVLGPRQTWGEPPVYV